jgi:hypothetical protein
MKINPKKSVLKATKITLKNFQMKIYVNRSVNFLLMINKSWNSRIALLIQISTSNNDEKPEEILLFNRKVTIEELFQISRGSERDYKYLASYCNKNIIDFHQLLSDVNETRFILVKEYQFCSLHIQRSTENQLVLIDGDESSTKQDFSSSATIADVYKANCMNSQNAYLLFRKDFLPSMETPLSIFTSTTPIEFDVINEKLPIHIIVQNSIDDQTIDYHSSSRTQFNRLCSNDRKTVLDEVKFELICTSPLKVFIKFEHVEILIPCTEETLASEVVEEALLKLNFSKIDLSQFELYALGDRQTQVDMDYTIEENREIFPENTEKVKLDQNLDHYFSGFCIFSSMFLN